MARWKVRVEFLLSVIELFSLALTLEALQGKMCQNSLPSGGVGQLEPRFQVEVVVPGEYVLVSTKLDTFCYLTVQTATVLRAVVLTQYRPVTGRRTDSRRTDGRNCHS